MKKTLYIAIIVIALGGAAVMGYMAFMGGGSSVEEVVVVEGESSASYNILPEGKTLDFNTIENFNKDGRMFPYPVVSPAEVGQVLGNIIE